MNESCHTCGAQGTICAELAYFDTAEGHAREECKRGVYM